VWSSLLAQDLYRERRFRVVCLPASLMFGSNSISCVALISYTPAAARFFPPKRMLLRTL